MTTRTCRVVRDDGLHLGPHPLATRTGYELFFVIFAMHERWRALTPRQREVLVAAYTAALDGAAEGESIPIPELPAATRPNTVDALERRHLVAEGRLTPLALEVVRWRPLPPGRAPTPPPEASTHT